MLRAVLMRLQWLAANMVISSFAIGVLGKSLFYLGAADAMLVVLFFNLLGITPVCYFSCFGPKFGLRQMIVSRFWFGWHGVKVIAFFNVLACIGWSSVNVIVGAQLINAVNNNVPGWAGIIIIAFCTVLVTLFGYKIVHQYAFWSWIPAFIVFMIVLGQFAHSGAFINIPMGVGTSEIGGVLSFGATVYGFATGWSSYAADYTVYQPVTQSKKKVFFATWLGLIIPLLFTQFLGVAVMTATGLDPDATDNPYLNGYKESGSGGLLGAVLIEPFGNFGRFCLVILALSIIANNCPNIYSVSLTAQVFGRWAQRVPRFVFTLIATGVYIAISIPGYSHFEEVLENFMNFIGCKWRPRLRSNLTHLLTLVDRLVVDLCCHCLHRTLCLPQGLFRLPARVLRPPVEAAARSCCDLRLLCGRRRFRVGHEPDLVCRPNRALVR